MSYKFNIMKMYSKVGKSKPYTIFLKKIKKYKIRLFIPSYQKFLLNYLILKFILSGQNYISMS